ncbi:hypothetical protein [Bradyrhizobium elkanii]|nr:hypothetical protein QIH80_18095 [Bradyrhizobium elkanii]
MSSPFYWAALRHRNKLSSTDSPGGIIAEAVPDVADHNVAA